MLATLFFIFFVRVKRKTSLVSFSRQCLGRRHMYMDHAFTAFFLAAKILALRDAMIFNWSRSLLSWRTCSLCFNNLVESQFLWGWRFFDTLFEPLHIFLDFLARPRRRSQFNSNCVAASILASFAGERDSSLAYCLMIARLHWDTNVFTSCWLRVRWAFLFTVSHLIGFSGLSLDIFRRRRFADLLLSVSNFGNAVSGEAPSLRVRSLFPRTQQASNCSSFLFSCPA